MNLQYFPLHITLEPKLPAAPLEVTSVSAMRQGWLKEMPMNLRNQDLCRMNFLQIYELISSTRSLRKHVQHMFFGGIQHAPPLVFGRFWGGIFKKGACQGPLRPLER